MGAILNESYRSLQIRKSEKIRNRYNDQIAIASLKDNKWSSENINIRKSCNQSLNPPNHNTRLSTFSRFMKEGKNLNQRQMIDIDSDNSDIDGYSRKSICDTFSENSRIT